MPLWTDGDVFGGTRPGSQRPSARDDLPVRAKESLATATERNGRTAWQSGRGWTIRYADRTGGAQIKPDSELAALLTTWQETFRTDAVSDAYEALRAHLRRFDLPDQPEVLLEGTIDVVMMCVGYATLDGQSSLDFIRRQTYDPSAADATYAVTFDIFGKGFARVLTVASLDGLDFADLYEVPWERYQVVGYSHFWISRTDGADLSAEELLLLERQVTEDLRFDYAEDELDFWFDPDTHEGALLVSVQDSSGVDED